MLLLLLFLPIFINQFYSLSSCPLSCVCSFDMMDMTCKNLKSIPEAFNENIQRLDLSGNIFNNLTSMIFSSFINLKVLKLNSCEIKYISKDAFGGLVNLRDLFLINNDIKELHQDTFRNLNNLLHLYLNNNEFELIPALTSFSMTRLNIDGNHISNAFIHETFKVNTALRSLVLSNNKIVSLNANDFINLRNTGLQSLMLKRNNITKIDQIAFKPVKDSLQNLELEGNNMLTSNQMEVALQAFSGGSKVLFIDLRSTGLVTVSRSFFAPLIDSNLHRIDIGNNNQLCIIDEDAFQELNHVHVLVADHCRLSSANIRFSALTGLKQVDLSHNNFAQCPHRMPGSIEFIDLSHNNIRYIYKDDFKSLSSLKWLNLTHNSISSIELTSFSDLSLLTFLDLSHNRLETIEPRIFVGMFVLSVLDLRRQTPCLKHISIHSFILPNLVELILDFNCIDNATINSPIFLHCPLLANLSLSWNSIEYLGDRFFDGCNNLSFLSLPRNNIRGWSSFTFRRVKSTLVDIDLSFNRLSFISSIKSEENYFPNDFPKLQTASFDNNRWNCSCNDVQWLLDHRRVIRNADKLLCEAMDSRIIKHLLDTTVQKDCRLKQEVTTHKATQVYHSNNVASIVIIIGFVLATVIALLVFRSHLQKLYQHLMKYCRSNPYKKFSNQNALETVTYSNPIMDEGLPDLCLNIEQTYDNIDNDDDSNLFFVGDLVNKTEWLDSVKYCNCVPNYTVVFVSPEMINIDSESLNVKTIPNLESFENKIAAYHCWKLVLDYPVLDKDIMKIIVTERRTESFNDEFMKDTYLFHKIDIVQSDDVVALFPDDHIIEYLDVDIADKLYNIL